MTLKPRIDRPLPRLLASAVLLALARAGEAQTSAAPAGATACQIGVLRCMIAKNPYAQCKRNDLLDFFVPGLPPAGDRSQAPTTAEADKVYWIDRTHAKLEGDPRVQRLDALIRSDVLTYDTQTTDYTATGHVRYQDASTLMSAAQASGTTTPDSTHLTDVRYQMIDQRGNGVAQQVDQTDPDHSLMRAVTFSTCDPDERQWEIRADDLEIDHVKNEGYGHGVTLVYDDVPFFWFPYISFPIDDERHTGFLMPSIGYSDRRGFKYGQPYYLDLAPNYDATLTPIDYSLRGPMVDGQFRYISAWNQFQVDGGYLPHDEEDSELGSRGFLRLRDWAMFDQNWGATVDVHHVSDDQYLRDFGDSFQSTAISMLQSSAYVAGHGNGWATTIGSDTWEVTDPGYEAFCPSGGALQTCASPYVFRPYTRLPHATFNANKTYGDFEFGIDADYANFRRGYSIQGQRLDSTVHIALPIETLAWFIRPELAWRLTHYDLTDLQYATPLELSRLGGGTTPTRSLPIASLDSGLFFERDANWFGTPYIQTLEPRLFYLYVPYRNQDALPSFDTALPSFDLPSLFRTNAYTGADRQSNANQATLALTTRYIDANTGDQLLSASIGQIRYFTTERVTLPGYPDLDMAGQDVFGEVSMRVGRNWDLTWQQQWNPHPYTLRYYDVNNLPVYGGASDRHTDLSTVSVEHRFGADGVFNFAYRFRRGYLEQYDVSTLIPLNLRWSVIGRYYYSLMDKRMLESFAGVQYDSCCVAMRVVARRYLSNISTAAATLETTGIVIPADVKPSTQVFFEVEFKGVGSSGTRTENFLRSTIMGYQP